MHRIVALGEGEHTKAGLLDKLRRDVGASERQLETVDAFCRLYRDSLLLPGGRARPLYVACPAAIECWARVTPDHRPPADQASISVPWVGPRYDEFRTVAVAINLNKYGGLGAHWWITNAEINDRLRRGTRRNFGYQVGRYLAALVSSRHEQSPKEQELGTQAAAAGWEACAFLEAVKCSPPEGVSKPTPEMWRNCPSRYLRRELDLLRPRTIIAIGQPVWWALEGVLAPEFTHDEPGFRRGRAAVKSEAVDLFFVNHPSYGHWRRSLPALLGSLRKQPLGL